MARVLLRSPKGAGHYPARVIRSHAPQGSTVAAGDLLYEIETAQGRKLGIRATRPGRVMSPPYPEGATLHAPSLLVELEPLAGHRYDKSGPGGTTTGKGKGGGDKTKPRAILLRTPGQTDLYPLEIAAAHLEQGRRVTKGDALYDLLCHGGRRIVIPSPASGRMASPAYPVGHRFDVPGLLAEIVPDSAGSKAAGGRDDAEDRQVLFSPPAPGLYPMEIATLHLAQGDGFAAGQLLMTLRDRSGETVRIIAPGTGKLASPLHSPGTVLQQPAALAELRLTRTDPTETTRERDEATATAEKAAEPGPAKPRAAAGKRMLGGGLILTAAAAIGVAAMLLIPGSGDHAPGSDTVQDDDYYGQRIGTERLGGTRSGAAPQARQDQFEDWIDS